jgi:hypothetical protein
MVEPSTEAPLVIRKFVQADATALAAFHMTNTHATVIQHSRFIDFLFALDQYLRTPSGNASIIPARHASENPPPWPKLPRGRSCPFSATPA